MSPLPPEIIALADQVRFPVPDAPIRSETVTADSREVQKLGVLIVALVEYVTIELERCGKETTQ